MKEYEVAVQPVDAIDTVSEVEVGVPAGLPTHLPLWRIVISLAIWPLLEQAMGSLVGLVDMHLAGYTSKAAADAIGGAGFFIWLMGLLQGAVGIGATALIARHIGANKPRDAEQMLGQAITLAVIWGTVNTILFLVLAPLVPRLLSLEGDAAALCVEYLQILSLVAMCRAVLFIGGSCLRGAGDMRSPFLIMVVVNIVNTVVSFALAAPWVRSLVIFMSDHIGGEALTQAMGQYSWLGGWGVKGIAIGTVVAWIVGGVLMPAVLIRGRGGVQLHWWAMKLKWDHTWRLIRIGLPAFLESLGHWVGNFCITAIVGGLVIYNLAENPVGTHAMAMRIESFSFLMGFAFNMAAATLAGQYLGANDPKTAKRAVMLAWFWGMGIMTTMGIMLMTMPQVFVHILTDKEPFLTEVPKLLFQAGWSQIGFATMMVLSGGIRGAGDTLTPMLITFGCTYLIRIPAVWIAAVVMGYGLVGVWFVMSVELMFRGLLYLGWFLHGKWLEVKV